MLEQGINLRSSVLVIKVEGKDHSAIQAPPVWPDVEIKIVQF